MLKVLDICNLSFEQCQTNRSCIADTCKHNDIFNSQSGKKNQTITKKIARGTGNPV